MFSTSLNAGLVMINPTCVCVCVCVCVCKISFFYCHFWRKYDWIKTFSQSLIHLQNLKIFHCLPRQKTVFHCCIERLAISLTKLLKVVCTFSFCLKYGTLKIFFLCLFSSTFTLLHVVVIFFVAILEYMVGYLSSVLENYQLWSLPIFLLLPSFPIYTCYST